MRQLQRKEQIAASIQRVWSILADVERWPEWTASVTRIEQIDLPPLGLGSRVRIHQPKLRPAVWVVTAWEPQSRFVWEAAGPGVTLIGSHVLKACDKGCEVTFGLRFDGWLGGLAALLKGRLAQRYVGCEAEGLKERSQNSLQGYTPPEADILQSELRRKFDENFDCWRDRSVRAGLSGITSKIGLMRVGVD